MGELAYFVKELGVSIEKLLNARKIECKIHIYNDTNLTEENVIKSEISTFSPDLIMQLTQRGQESTNGIPTGGVLN